jgi:multiple sugar transport system substrate-binding protein
MLREVPAEYLQPGHRYAWLDILPVYRHKLLTWDGKVYGLPLLGDAPLCYFRADWLRDADNVAAFKTKHGRELTPPKTWDEFAEIAAFFNGRPTADDKQTVNGLPPVPAQDEGIDREFYSMAAAFARLGIREDDKQPPPDEEIFSFHYDITNGEMRITKPGFTAALGMFERLRKYRPTETMGEPEEAFRAGRAALCLTGTRWISRFQQHASIRGRFGTCRIPGSLTYFSYQAGEPQTLGEVNYVPYLGAGGWLAVVPMNTQQPNEAFALIAELSGPQASGEILLSSAWGGGPFRNQHLSLIGKANAFELESAQTQALVEQLRLTLAPPIINPLLRLRTPDQESHFRAMAGGLRSGKMLEQIADEWRRLDARISPEQRLRDYRLSLSLPAQLPR